MDYLVASSIDVDGALPSFDFDVEFTESKVLEGALANVDR